MGVGRKLPSACVGLYHAIHRKCVEEAWVEVNRMELKRRADHSGNPFLFRDEKDGDAILEALRNDVANNAGVTWSADQNMFIEQIWLTILNHIYKNSLGSNLDRLMASNPHWKRFMQVLDIMCPRRWGKTTTIGGTVAIIAKNLRNIEISIFSPGRRPSKKLLELIYSFVCKLGIEHRVVRYNVETLWLIGDDEQDIRKIFSYPSKVKIILPLCCGVCMCMCVHCRKKKCSTASFFCLSLLPKTGIPMMKKHTTAFNSPQSASQIILTHAQSIRKWRLTQL